MKTSLQNIEKDFVVAFSKIGPKHSAAKQIDTFKQRKGELVRDYVNRLKQYVARCPDDEKPSQKRLISIFLAGLRNKKRCMHTCM